MHASMHARAHAFAGTVPWQQVVMRLKAKMVHLRAWNLWHMARRARACSRQAQADGMLAGVLARAWAR